MTEAVASVHFEAWLGAETNSERRHEYVGGRTYVMAGGTERHDLAAGLVYEALAPAARQAGCRPFLSNRIVRTPAGSGYYPDVMVACGRAPHRLYETQPTLIVEVLSPSPPDVDRREKALAFAAIASLKTLLLIDPDSRRIEQAGLADGVVAGWTTFGPGDVIPTAYGVVDVDAIYDALDAVATT